MVGKIMKILTNYGKKWLHSNKENVRMYIDEKGNVNICSSVKALANGGKLLLYSVRSGDFLVIKKLNVNHKLKLTLKVRTMTDLNATVNELTLQEVGDTFKELFIECDKKGLSYSCRNVKIHKLVFLFQLLYLYKNDTVIIQNIEYKNQECGFTIKLLNNQCYLGQYVIEGINFTNEKIVETEEISDIIDSVLQENSIDDEYKSYFKYIFINFADYDPHYIGEGLEKLKTDLFIASLDQNGDFDNNVFKQYFNKTILDTMDSSNNKVISIIKNFS